MKLLFDENLSYKLVRSPADLFPNSAHPQSEYARDNDFIIVSKDSDFYQPVMSGSSQAPA
ncbi:MAG TPA: DUF5615 family PIN-like protein [Blastocatellia bacterium]